MNWRQKLSNLFVQAEPPVPNTILGEAAARFATLPAAATVCIKVSAAHDQPYPFAVSGRFVARAVQEIQAANSALKILLTEGGVGAQPVLPVAERHGLTALPGVTFVDAEACAPVFVPNPNPQPYQTDGFWLPTHWVEADCRVLLTTCKVRSHHFQRWYSGGTRNLIGLLPRSQYKLSTSRREMRSMLHQRGMDAMVADLYATTGQNILTILDCRLLARHDEHLPMRFTKRIHAVLVADDPYRADDAMAHTLDLPFTPPYLAMIAKAGLLGGTEPVRQRQTA
ncbi:MAG TPA: DUF362 domain-containing protein [Chthonomonadaceae bacterium]|nr:DUF362 domain-containing protein [Chthonomonadaceae bacterium]